MHDMLPQPEVAISDESDARPEPDAADVPATLPGRSGTKSFASTSTAASPR
jgi:hypothetical protein